MEHSGNEVKRQSQVTEQTDNLTSNLGILHDRFESLAERLSSVLRSLEVPKQGEGKDKAELVALACTIEGFDDSVKSVIYKIEDLLERIEL